MGSYRADTFANRNANGGPYQAFLYQGGVFSTIAVPDVLFTALSGINDKNLISGYYEDTNGIYHSFLITP